jgi:sugar-specific transcriptional regulator TrmB
MKNSAEILTERQPDALDMLMAFDLTRQEAAVYSGLLEEGGLNGYEAAKNLGVSRSNAYTALASLVDKGAACVADGTPVRYVPVHVDDFCANHIRRLEKFRSALKAMPGPKEPAGGYVTITGSENIVNGLRHLLERAEERVYLSLSGAVLCLCLQELKTLIAAGKKVVIITDRESVADRSFAESLAGAILYAGEVSPSQIRAIADSRFVLTGELTGGKAANCLFSDRPNLVDIFKNALRNEIRLIEMGVISGGGDTDELF